MRLEAESVSSREVFYFELSTGPEGLRCTCQLPQEQFIMIYHIQTTNVCQILLFIIKLTMRSLIKFHFSKTLQVIKQNKILIPEKRKQVGFTGVVGKENKKLLQYNTINDQYVKEVRAAFLDDFSDLDVFKNKLEAQQALASGANAVDQYNQFSLPKIINICLKKLVQKDEQKQTWEKLEQRCQKLFRNTSVIDNIQLFYIAIQKFSPSFQQDILKSIEEQIKIMSQMERQFLYYTLCRINPLLSDKIDSRVKLLKNDLHLFTYKTKLTLNQIIQWIILLGIGDSISLQALYHYYQKVSLYQKYVLSPDQLFVMLRCLEIRSNMLEDHKQKWLRMHGENAIKAYHSKITNGNILLEAMKDHIKMKLISSYYFAQINHQNGGNQQIFINESSLIINEKLKYLFWSWKNGYLEQYELNSLYSQLTKSQPDWDSNKGSLDIIYYICWLELGLKIIKQEKIVVKLAQKLEYIPKGMEWPLWNYLLEVTKQNTAIEDKEAIQKIINKIKDSKQTRKKVSKLREQSERLSKTKEIEQMAKFFHSIKAWNFKKCQPISCLDYIAHFVHQNMKVIIHCLLPEDYTISTQKSGAQQKRINNKHLANMGLLCKNFGYRVINLEIDQFSQLNYTQKIDLIRSKLDQFGSLQQLQLKF